MPIRSFRIRENSTKDLGNPDPAFRQQKLQCGVKYQQTFEIVALQGGFCELDGDCNFDGTRYGFLPRE